MPTPSRIARKARALLPRRGFALRGRLRTRSVLLETVATAALYVVAGAGPFEGRTERFDDCLHVETRFTLLRGQQPLRETIGSDWYCAEVGLVQSEELDASTGVATRSVLVGRDGGAEDTTLLPSATVLASLADRSARPSSEAPPASSSPGATLPNAVADLSQPLAWTLTRVGRARVTADAGESTIPPVWVPGDPPLLLVAGYAGDLIALDAGDELGTIRWRFRPAGTVFSPPAYDPANGRIYFGAGDRRLYALDTRGLFLWSFQTGDNVATRPLVLPLSIAMGRGSGVGLLSSYSAARTAPSTLWTPTPAANTGAPRPAVPSSPRRSSWAMVLSWRSAPTTARSSGWTPPPAMSAGSTPPAARSKRRSSPTTRACSTSPAATAPSPPSILQTARRPVRHAGRRRSASCSARRRPPLLHAGRVPGAGPRPRPEPQRPPARSRDRPGRPHHDGSRRLDRLAD